MDAITFIRAAAKYIGAGLGGGAVALAGALGASILGEASANVIKNVLDYAVFDVEEGYFRDHPDRINEPAIKRIWRIWHE